ncbi:MAG: MotA/TolQ/ExbB proton channel family protein [Ignavibacteriaceae bacterium]|nr:MotA/TolQ/ExbB proton channel family protein [Ignavibacteriaceae bacterium]
MKNSLFFIIMFILAFAISIVIYMFVLGNPANFSNGELRTVPVVGNMLGTIYVGGPLVALLIFLSIIDVAIIFERMFSLKKAGGKRSVPAFFKDVITALDNSDYTGAIEICDKQRGSVANVIKASVSRYVELTANKKDIEAEKLLVEIQRSVEEATMLETPLLEKNLIVLSTVASIATMIGLLGTVIGMIRSFSAMARAGAPDAIALANGISEALINTAGGLICGVMGIVAYNFFTNKVDTFTYSVDEASYNVLQILKSK